MEQNVNDLQNEIARLSEELADMKGKLEKQEKLASLGMLSAGIAHEVQNPLNFVINFSKLSTTLLGSLSEVIDDCADSLDEDDADDIRDIADDLKENLGKIQEHGERAISIIRGILLQSRGKEGEFLPTDIQQLVHEYVWLSYHAMRANDKSFNISIQEDYQPDIPKLMTVPQDLSRAVLNVMNNACYTVKERAAGGEQDYQPTISVKVTFAESEGLAISISDNGMGMTDEIKKKLFDNFFTTKPIGQGTGLGMGIIRSIITEEHKGELLVDTAPGVGTTLTFKIPVLKGSLVRM
ncbi:MAG: two-component sensor histidine kinase [Bacteroidales bacterium]|nr:two-component sensor histidine kinase [Candidatus Cacconaster merdequi]